MRLVWLIRAAADPINSTIRLRAYLLNAGSAGVCIGSKNLNIVVIKLCITAKVRFYRDFTFIRYNYLIYEPPYKILIIICQYLDILKLLKENANRGTVR